MGYDGYIMIGTKVDTSGVNKGLKKTEDIISSKSFTVGVIEDEKQLKNLNVNWEKINKSVKLYKQNLAKPTVPSPSKEIKEVQEQLKKTEIRSSNVLKKIGKWTLAIFGVRSAYSAIRSAMSLVEGNNEKIASQINTMKMAVANALTPVIQKIVDIVKTLMLYIDYIVFKLSGKHLFNFTKAFKDANKNSAETSKNISKTVAGFDEMNVVQDTSSASASGTTGGALENPFEGWENFEPPKWLDAIVSVLDWIKKYWKEIVIGVLAIGAGFLIFKGFSFFKDLFSKKTAEDITKVGTSFTGFFDGIGKGIEAIAILGGLTLVIYAVTDMIETFGKSGVKVTEVLGIMGTVVGSIVVLITALTLATQALQSPIAMAGLVLLTGAISAILLVVAETLPTILDAIGKFTSEVGPVLNKMIETIGNSIQSIIIALGTSLPPIINSVGSLFEKVFKGIDKVVSTVGKVIVDILNTAKSLVTTVLNSILTFINKLGPAINNFVDNAIKAVTKLINFMVSGIEYLVNTLVIDGVNAIIKGINKIGKYVGFTIPVIPDFEMRRFVPKLAVGGIVNMPGKGVPIGGAITGEVSKEGVIPLTDSQAMQELGRTIGQYITVNANITNSMNGRVISRELKKINANDNFAFNG